MGEAKRRQHEHAQWTASLDDKERVVAATALHIHDRLAKHAGLVQACYFYAMFMTKYLKQEKGIDVTPVIGWASHGDALFAHAWIDVDGKRVDLSLTRTTKPDVAPPGELIVLDRAVKAGAPYVYHADTTEDIAAAVGQQRLDFCARMRAIAADAGLIDQYFEEGPSEYRYDVVLGLLK
jgi:hypothetical protein